MSFADYLLLVTFAVTNAAAFLLGHLHGRREGIDMAREHVAEAMNDLQRYADSVRERAKP